MSVSARTIYVSLGGSDAGTGGEGAPFASLQKAVAMARPGDTILLQPGTYTNPDVTGVAVRISGLSGTEDAPITIRGNGGLAVIDASPNTASWGSYAMDVKNASHIVFENLGFTGAKQNGEGSWAVGANVTDSSDLTFRNCTFFDNEGVGLLISGKSADNKVVNSDAHDNYDPLSKVDGGNADGFQLSGIPAGYGGNELAGCRSWNNSDDGFDLYNANSAVTITGCEAWHNGYLPGTDTPSGGDGDGFKLGTSAVPVSHTVEGNVAHDNRVYGFDSNGVKGPLLLDGNTAYGNGENYYLDDDIAHRLTGNVSRDGGAPDVLGDASVGSADSWDDDGGSASSGGAASGGGSASGGGAAASPAPVAPPAGVTLVGTGRADVLAGGAGDDILHGKSGDDVLAGGGGADRIEGNAGADSLSGDAGADMLLGGGGDDVLIGGAGADRLSGGAGGDHFLFRSPDEIGRGTAADTIVDFKAKAGDRIDLTAIDAAEGKAGNQAFTLVGALTGHAGELSFDGASGMLRGDTDGDGQADFEIALLGVHTLPGDALLL